MLARHLRDGSHAETLTQRHLESRGLSTVVRNFRCRLGELDLVMLHEDCLVIVEVRYRRRASHGGALASVSPQKQRRLVLATRYLLLQHPWLQQHPLRFDVVAVYGPLQAPTFDWCRRAFDCSSD